MHIVKRLLFSALFLSLLLTQNMLMAMSTFTVTNTSSSVSQSGSLPWAIAQARNAHTATKIDFDISPADGTIHTIVLADRLWINEPVTIDGRTQGGYSDHPLIRIDVNGLANAFTILGPDSNNNGASSTVIAGLQIYNFSANALATQPGADNIHIVDNYIGFYRDEKNQSWWRNFEATLTEDEIQNGQTAIYNGFTSAVGIGIQSSYNIIEKNVISGVHNGISIGYDFFNFTEKEWGPVNQGNRISSNLIGT